MTRKEENFVYGIELEKFIIRSFHDYELQFDWQDRDGGSISKTENWSIGVRQSRLGDWLYIDIWGVNDLILNELDPEEDSKVFTNYITDICKKFMSLYPVTGLELKFSDAEIVTDYAEPVNIKALKFWICIYDRQAIRI